MPSPLEERFAALAADVGRLARPATAHAIRRRVQTRYRTQLALAVIGAGVGALTAGSMLIATLGPAPAPAGMPKPPTEISADLRMPHEGEEGWVRDDNPTAPSAFNPCGGEDLTLVDRVDASAVTGPAQRYAPDDPAEHFVDELLLFGSAASARQALDGLDAEMRSCGWGGGQNPYTDYGQRVLIAATDRIPQRGPYERVIVTLRRNAMIVMYASDSGAYPFGYDYGAIEFIASQVCTTMGLCEERLCYNGYPSPGSGTPMPEPVPCTPSGSPMTPGGHESPWPGTGDPSRNGTPNVPAASITYSPAPPGAPTPTG